MKYFFCFFDSPVNDFDSLETRKSVYHLLLTALMNLNVLRTWSILNMLIETVTSDIAFRFEVQTSENKC